MKLWPKSQTPKASFPAKATTQLKWTQEDEERLANSLQDDALLREIHRMHEAGEDFFHDGFWTAIRLITLTPELEERLSKAFYEFLVKYRRNAMQVGFKLIWEGYVKSGTDSDQYYLVVTLEGFCPKCREEFDRAILART